MKEIKIQHSEKVALIDDEDFERISKFKWHFNENGGSVYRFYTKYAYKTSHIAIANEVMKDYDHMFDHKDSNSLNESKSNLRICSYSQNGHHRKKKKNTSSKYIGVCWAKKCKKWLASIMKDGKNMCLGYFSNEILAALAYDKKARELFGEFANCNYTIT